MRGAARSAITSICFLIICSLILASCGGGGGADSPSITYSGLTTEASVTDSNADDISATALQGSGPGTLGGVASLTEGASGTEKTGRQLYFTLSRMLEEAVRENIGSSAGDGRVVHSNTSYVPGNCPDGPGYAVFY